MTTKEILIKARALIEKPENWKQKGLAETNGGEIVGPFCSLGAIGKTCEIFAIGAGPTGRTGEGSFLFAPSMREKNSGNPEAEAEYEAAAKLLKECMDEDVHVYNDTHSHECVMQLFDTAIERAEG